MLIKISQQNINWRTRTQNEEIVHPPSVLLVSPRQETTATLMMCCSACTRSCRRRRLKSPLRWPLIWWSSTPTCWSRSATTVTCLLLHFPPAAVLLTQKHCVVKIVNVVFLSFFCVFFFFCRSMWREETTWKQPACWSVSATTSASFLHVSSHKTRQTGAEGIHWLDTIIRKIWLKFPDLVACFVNFDAA